MRFEGGYVYDPADRGGETYRGVTRRNWPRWQGWQGVDSAKRRLGLENTLGANRIVRRAIDSVLAPDTVLQRLVREFYRTNYWDPLCLAAEPTKRLAASIFDEAVNSGVEVARRLARAVRLQADSLVSSDPLFSGDKDTVRLRWEREVGCSVGQVPQRRN